MTLTNNDLHAIKGMLDDFKEEVDESLDKRFTKQRSDFFDKVDPILKEVIINREERVVVSEKISNHEDRLQNIEVRLQLSTE